MRFETRDNILSMSEAQNNRLLASVTEGLEAIWTLTHECCLPQTATAQWETTLKGALDLL